MKFGNLYWQQTPDFSFPADRRINEGIDLAVQSEELGWDYAWFAEQHFHNYGYSPNPLMIAQQVANRTTHLRLGMSIVVLPLWNPVRLAEDFALLDIFSNGRCDLGIGRGFQHVGFRGFSVDLADRQELFDEGLEVLLRSWTTDGLVFQGKHYDFPHGMNVLPKPLQTPHPPIWVAVTSEDNIRWVAKTDFRVFGSANWGTKDQAQRDRELYLEERAKAGLEGDHWSYALNRQVFVVPPGGNYQALKREFEERARYHIRMGRGLRFDTAAYNKGEVTAPHLENEESTDQLFDRIVFGYAHEVTEQLLELNDIVPIDMMISQMDFAGLAHERVRECQELFGSEVIPAIRKELGDA